MVPLGRERGFSCAHSCHAGDAGSRSGTLCRCGQCPSVYWAFQSFWRVCPHSTCPSLGVGSGGRFNLDGLCGPFQAQQTRRAGPEQAGHERIVAGLACPLKGLLLQPQAPHKLALQCAAVTPLGKGAGPDGRQWQVIGRKGRHPLKDTRGGVQVSELHVAVTLEQHGLGG